MESFTYVGRVGRECKYIIPTPCHVAQIPYWFDFYETLNNLNKLKGFEEFLKTCMMLHVFYKIFNRKKTPAAESKATKQCKYDSQ